MPALAAIALGMLTSVSANAQTPEERARFLYLEAESAKNDEDYARCADLLEDVEEKLGRRTLRVQGLLVECRYQASDWEATVQEAREYFALKPDKNMEEYKNIGLWLVRAEEALATQRRAEAEAAANAEAARLAQQQREEAEARQVEQKLIEQERREIESQRQVAESARQRQVRSHEAAVAAARLEVETAEAELTETRLAVDEKYTIAWARFGLGTALTVASVPFGGLAAASGVLMFMGMGNSLPAPIASAVAPQGDLGRVGVVVATAAVLAVTSAVTALLGVYGAIYLWEGYQALSTAGELELAIADKTARVAEQREALSQLEGGLDVNAE